MSRTNGQWCPPEWADRIRRLSAGELTPVTPRRAATVVLVRDGADGLDVHMLRRSATMAFASGVYAYPGGSVDPRDERDVAWAGPSRAEWAARLAGGRTGGDGCGTGRDAAAGSAARTSSATPAGARAVRDVAAGDWGVPDTAAGAGAGGTGTGAGEPDAAVGAGEVSETVAQAVVCAAVRETFEETGVLLAGPTPRAVVADTTGADWEADRAALVDREFSFADFLTRRGLVLRSDLLGCWARWITPEFEARRYDTWFFVAALPDGQLARNASTEADRTVWIRPSDAVAGYDRGDLVMLPPTIAVLRTLARYRTAAEALAAADDQDLTPVLARARLDGEQLVLSWPGHEEFTLRFPAPADGAAAPATAVTPAAPAARGGDSTADADGPAAGRAGGAPGADTAAGADTATGADAGVDAAGGATGAGAAGGEGTR